MHILRCPSDTVVIVPTTGIHNCASGPDGYRDGREAWPAQCVAVPKRRLMINLDVQDYQSSTIKRNGYWLVEVRR